MRSITQGLRTFFAKADVFLLFLCTATSIFGVIIIRSATNYLNSSRTVIVQSIAIAIGVLLYIFFSVFPLTDTEILTERREVLFIFNFILIALLFSPLSVTEGGNRNWIRFPGIPFNIQPSEVCKVTFILIIAKMMSVYRENISKITNVLRLGFQLIFIVGFLLVASDDAGSALVYVLIFLVMLWAGGVSILYFALGAGALVVGFPVLWNLEIGGSTLIREDQKERIMMIFDSSIDPLGTDVRWQTKNSLLTLTNGGVTGQGLFQGLRTQNGMLSQQHTDFIFSVVGEELGIVGCLLVILLLAGIVVRCFYVGHKCGNYMNRMICVGIGSMVMWQMVINIGMCIGVTPVIGLTLPFISYGGSSIISLFVSMGIISGISARQTPDTDSHYIRPPY